MFIPLRGIYGHSVHLRIRFETFLEVVCFCAKLAQIVLRDNKAINMSFYILSIMQIMNKRTGQCLFITLNSCQTAQLQTHFRFKHLKKIFEGGCSLVSSVQPLFISALCTNFCWMEKIVIRFSNLFNWY